MSAAHQQVAEGTWTCPVCTARAQEDKPPEWKFQPVATQGPEGTIVWNVRCPRCGEYRISETDRTRLLERTGAADGAVSFPLDRMHLVSGYLRELTVNGQGGATLTAQSAAAMADAAPRSVPERTDRLLLNLSAASDYAGHRLEIDGRHDYPLAYARSGRELMFLLHHLVADGLLDGPPPRAEVPYVDWAAVSLKGWSRVSELRSRSTSYTQAFVAMSFDPTLERVYSEAIAPAIRECGYEPLLLSRHEHADRVDERIVLELNRSRFVVAEFAQHRPSVYFEAGYAVGRGLPVIWTCRASDYPAAQFDTRQYNHIVWNDLPELRERLSTRIKVVIG